MGQHQMLRELLQQFSVVARSQPQLAGCVFFRRSRFLRQAPQRVHTEQPRLPTTCDITNLPPAIPPHFAPTQPFFRPIAAVAAPQDRDHDGRMTHGRSAAAERSPLWLAHPVTSRFLRFAYFHAEKIYDQCSSAAGCKYPRQQCAAQATQINMKSIGITGPYQAPAHPTLIAASVTQSRLCHPLKPLSTARRILR